MDLLANYGSDDSEQENTSDVEDPAPIEVRSAEKKRKTVALPSASELFSSVEGASFLTAASPVPTPEVAPLQAKKKKKKNTDAFQPASRTKMREQLLPPQLARPNLSTEDYRQWSTTKSADAHNDSKKKDKSSKDAKSFNSREKRKRDLGMQSRHKNFVEEEKRLLRQAGDF